MGESHQDLLPCFAAIHVRKWRASTEGGFVMILACALALIIAVVVGLSSLMAAGVAKGLLS